MNAKDCRKIIDKHYSGNLGDCLCLKCDHARLYFNVLQGEEVKELVEALKKIMQGNGTYEIGEDPFVLAEKALSKYREAIK